MNPNNTCLNCIFFMDSPVNKFTTGHCFVSPKEHSVTYNDKSCEVGIDRENKNPDFSRIDFSNMTLGFVPHETGFEFISEQLSNMYGKCIAGSSYHDGSRLFFSYDMIAFDNLRKDEKVFNIHKINTKGGIAYRIN